MTKLRKVTIAYELEDLGWQINTFVTTLGYDTEVERKFFEHFEGNGILKAKIVDWVRVNTLEELTDLHDTTIIQ